MNASPATRPNSMKAPRATRLESTLTADGWRLALHVFEPVGAARRHAVVCCHGLAANHVAFDAAADLSLAQHLAQRGYLVIVAELRNHGASERASLRGPRGYGWSFDDYVHNEVPAIIAAAGNLAGQSKVHWIGHSMGGVLLYAHLARGGSATIRSAITVGSSLDYSGSASGFHALLKLRPLLRRLPLVPVGRLARAAAPLVGRVRTPYEAFNVWSSNMDLRLWRRVAEGGFHDVSTPVMDQLASALAPGGLRSLDGRIRYADGLAAAAAPVLALAGDRDAQCPVEAARQTVELLAAADARLQVFGPAHGQADHYGHFDLLIGRRARAEVYPHIDAWLDRHDK